MSKPLIILILIAQIGIIASVLFPALDVIDSNGHMQDNVLCLSTITMVAVLGKTAKCRIDRKKTKQKKAESE